MINEYFKELNKLNDIYESFEIHSQLNDKIFNLDDNLMKQEIRQRLIEIADLFVSSIQENNVPIKVYDYWLVGSNAAYNYTKDSDIDIHIIVDMDIVQEPYLLRLLYDYIKSSFSQKYDIAVKGHEVELYLEDIKTSAVTNGIYSLKQDKWLKFPQEQEPRIIDIEETPLFAQWLDRYEHLEDEECEQFLDDLYVMRKISLANDGEFGDGNLIFKEFRNRGYLDDLKDRKYKFESDRLTLEKLEEGVLNEATLTDIVSMVVRSLTAIPGVTCDVDDSKEHIIVKTPLNKEYAIPIKDLPKNVSFSNDYKKIKFNGSCTVTNGLMPNPVGAGTAPVYYGVPIQHKHRDFDKNVKVYDLLQNRISGKPFSLDDFILGIKNNQL